MSARLTAFENGGPGEEEGAEGAEGQEIEDLMSASSAERPDVGPEAVPKTKRQNDMKMQNQNTKRLTSTAAAPDQAQKNVIPKVRYHPTIQTPTRGDGARAKTRTSQNQKTRPPVHHVHNGTDNKAQVNPVPAVRRRPNGGQKQKQRAATDPDPKQKPDELSDTATPRPEQVSLDLEVPLDRSVVKEVEVQTRGQRTNQNWFDWRKNRITASVAHYIANCRFVNGKSKTPPISYVAAVTGQRRSIHTRAMNWGIHMEAEVVRKYQEMKTTALGRPVLVRECGLFIDDQRPWLAASPDGIVTDRQTGQWLLCLEVKCPYKHRNSWVEDACRNDRAFCLEIQDRDGSQPGESPVYSLKRTHSYFTQIQCQLAVTGLQQADLVVFTLKETAIVPVTFDPDFWEKTASKLEKFYKDAVLPYIRERRQQDAKAAGTPEP
uniref:uncharacterized protein LOC124058716 isoform X2 n=1 Tax=Scatophagus argus TaxID=75038 RepID=UPI001ED7DAF0|nr:uncharacterized protein LOC124058716 isoform X2 [Scatophagus argus]